LHNRKQRLISAEKNVNSNTRRSWRRYSTNNLETHKLAQGSAECANFLRHALSRIGNISFYKSLSSSWSRLSSKSNQLLLVTHPTTPEIYQNFIKIRPQVSCSYPVIVLTDSHTFRHIVRSKK